MATIILQLDATLLSNPDLDIRYLLPDLLVERFAGHLSDDGYDYVDNGSASPFLQIYLQTGDAPSVMPELIRILKSERISGNDLSEIPIAIEDDGKFKIVHPPAFSGTFVFPTHGW